MDRSYLYGDALFETVRIEDGRAHRLPRHANRFESSARELGFDEDTITAGLAAIHGLTSEADGLWRVTVSRSPHGAPFGGEGGVTVTRRPIPKPDRPTVVSLRGWWVQDDPVGMHKSTSYLRWVEARRRALARGADDALLVTLDGLVGETSTANVFVRFGRVLATPPVRGLLPGVTRAAVLEHGSELGLVCEERDVSLDELLGADEVICTSTGVLATSVVSVDTQSFDQEYGPRLRESLRGGWP